MSDFISAKNDVVFKVLFSKNKELLRQFLYDVLDISVESTDDITILNPELPPISVDGKASRLDINVHTSKQNINIEMQVESESDFRERILFYWAKMYSDDLGKGHRYGELKKSYSVSILNFNIFDCENYHSSFSIREDNRNEQLTDKLSMHIFELKKVEKILNTEDKSKLWMQFISAEDKEALDMLMNSNNTAIQTGVQKIYELNANEQLKEYIRQRDKTIRDYESAIANAELKGHTEGHAKGRVDERNSLIEKWRKKGKTEEEIRELLED